MGLLQTAHVTQRAQTALSGQGQRGLWRRLWRRLGAALLAVCLLLATPAWAQDSRPERPLPTSNTDTHLMEDLSDEELREQGWDFRPQDRAPGSVGCGLWAILVSTVWHGWGHRCARDDSSHVRLLIAEGVALGLLASAATIAILSNDADTLNPVWSSLFHSGLVLFAATYALDLIGTFKGGARSLAPNQRHIDGIKPSLHIRWVPNDSFDLTALLGLEVEIRSGRLWITPKGLLDITSLNYWSVGGDLGYKLWQGKARATYFALATESRYEDFGGLGFQVLNVLPYVELSFDASVLLPHLENIHFINRIGYGFEFYGWDALGTDHTFKDTTSILVLETELSMNLLDDFNIAINYRQRPDLLVGPLRRAGRLWGAIPTPGIGIFGVNLDFRTAQGWSAAFEVNLGTLVEFWLSFGRAF